MFSHETQPVAKGNCSPTTLSALLECSQFCQNCVEVFIEDNQVQSLRDLIRSTANCSDICQATAKVLSRKIISSTIPHYLASTCIEQLRDTASLCSSFAYQHQLCSPCAEMCKKCDTLLSEFLLSSILPET